MLAPFIVSDKTTSPTSCTLYSGYSDGAGLLVPADESRDIEGVGVVLAEAMNEAEMLFTRRRSC